jgi:hypothetical protein
MLKACTYGSSQERLIEIAVWNYLPQAYRTANIETFTEPRTVFSSENSRFFLSFYRDKKTLMFWYIS